ncbi:NTP transferase domain-containing protein [Comamonas sp. NLF-1-9]|uniref:nucleotidyltransferase family protein n=1 Tax=Comamonas sp. NLF-1-9 TaxID=2853163 RepID=UPI001C477589|nr:nucleotidyltransferase family protein [Comamonas sp. NLF-1-9]QXL83810.1 nucleotidyltransferase family protein [Comamonas sp. NLF-1-9]
MTTPDCAHPCGAVLLAAGAGRRMGGRPKALLLRDGEPLLLRQARLLAAAGCAPVVVVLGHHRDALLPVLQAARGEHPELMWTTNPAPEDDPASSLRCGLAALPAALDTIVVALGDQPLLQEPDFHALLHAWRARGSGAELLVPMHAGAPGHPLVFGALLRQAVQQGDSVRQWRRAHPERVQTLAADHARYTTDVDTPESLQSLQQAHGVTLTWPA